VHGADVDGCAGADWIHRLLFRGIMRGADRIVACSEALARQTAEAFPEVREKVTWVHNGLDPSRYVEARESAVPQPFLLCVCRHVHKKGVDTLLRAFALIRDDAPDVSLVLVGDGPLFREHKGLAARLQIEDRVVFMGEVAHSDVPPFFSKCTLFVLPSRAEPFGLVLLEAAYHSKPIVCTRVGGVPEIITSGVNGLLVESDDPSAMAAQILTLLRNDELARRLGGAAHATLFARFLWKDRIQDYIDIYEGRRGPSLDKEEQETRSAVRHDPVASVDLR
jgi:glycosyltransferase involved in cell wall biosynthesis